MLCLDHTVGFGQVLKRSKTPTCDAQAQLGVLAGSTTLYVCNSGRLACMTGFILTGFFQVPMSWKSVGSLQKKNVQLSGYVIVNRAMMTPGGDNPL